jgi:AcrR family transcriptional regulator
VPRAFEEGEREQIRARLLGAAEDALAGAGPRKTRVEALTRAAGISKGAFYLFFPSREALWAELALAREAGRRVALRAELHRDGPDRLSRVLGALLRSLVDDPLLRALAEPAEAAWVAAAWPEEAARAARGDDPGFVEALFDGLVERGAAREDGRDVFLAMPALAVGLARQRAALGDRGPVLVGTLVAALARELEPRRARR